MKMKVAIIGASDLGRQLLHQIEQYCSAEVVGFFDDFANGDCVLGKTSEVVAQYAEGRFDAILIGVGYKVMTFRAKILSELEGKVPLFVLRSPTAIIDPSADVSEGSVLLHGTIVDQDVSIDKNCFFSLGCTVSHQSVVGRNTYCGPHVTICGKCRVGANCFIGAGSVVRDGVNIADDVTIGAGAVVVKDIAKSGVYVGCPAKSILEVK